MSGLTNDLTEAADVLHEWGQRSMSKMVRAGVDRIDELEAEVQRLHTAEFVGRLPDYVKELETERDEADARIDELEKALRLALEVIDDGVAEVLRLDPHIQHPDGTGWDCGHEVLEIRRALGDQT